MSNAPIRHTNNASNAARPSILPYGIICGVLRPMGALGEAILGAWFIGRVFFVHEHLFLSFNPLYTRTLKLNGETLFKTQEGWDLRDRSIVP